MKHNSQEEMGWENPSGEQQPESLTVSQLNNLIRDVIGMGIPNAVWVCGEIQGYNRNRDKKHIFFELCEKDPETKDTTARIGLVIFAGRKAVLQDILRSSADAFELKDDIEVKFLCRVDFYPPYGTMRLIVESIDPVYTLGRIAQERQKLIAFLRKNGTLEKNKRVPLAEVPLSVGLITAMDSAAYNDFIEEMRLSGLGFRVFFRNALMQGQNAPPDICAAMDDLARIKGLNVIVITRGGGSISDLSCFDNRAIAEKIAEVPLPVVTGIGHEINVTVADLAAHTFCKTPTAVAQFLTQRVENFLTGLEEAGYLIVRCAEARILETKSQLRQTAFALQQGTVEFLQEHDRHLIRIVGTVQSQPLRLLKEAGRRLDEQTAALEKTATRYLQDQDKRMEHYFRLMELADPVRILKKGFSITRRADGRLARRAEDLEEEEEIVTRLEQGAIRSRVESINKEDDGG